MKNGNGKVHLRAPGYVPGGRRYPRLLCTSRRAKRILDTALFRNYGRVPVKRRCILCNEIYHRLRNGGKGGK
jgi:hypothetical protein